MTATPTSPPGAGAFARFLDVTVVRDEPDGVFEIRVEADERHENQFGVVHGGLQMTLLDMAMGGAVARSLGPGERCASVNINTDFVRPGARGPLIARGTILRKGRTMAFPTGELVDMEGRIIARAMGVWTIRS